MMDKAAAKMKKYFYSMIQDLSMYWCSALCSATEKYAKIKTCNCG